MTASYEGIICHSDGSLHPCQDPPTLYNGLRMEGSYRPTSQLDQMFPLSRERKMLPTDFIHEKDLSFYQES